MSSSEGLEPMDLDKGNSSASCSICLDLVLDRGERSVAKLHCGHEFHLDCIGSAFNVKGAMQCPNCRKVEKGRWLFANGHRSSSDFDLDAWVAEDFYDLTYEMPFGFWCPFRGITHLASLIEEGESQLNSYHESSGNNTTYGDHPSASSSTHVCPYQALHGHSHAIMHSNPSSSSVDAVAENNTFPRHPTNLGGGQASADMLNSHNSFSNTEPQHNRNWQPQHSLPFSFLGNATDQPSSQFGPRLPRSDAGSQQRLGSFVHLHPIHGSGPSSGSNLVALLGRPPSIMGEMRPHTHNTRRHSSNHIYQQPLPSSSLMSAPPFPPPRRSRPRGFTLVSTSSSASEIGGFYGFASVSSSSTNRSHQDPESMARHFNRFYGTPHPLPWIPLEGESQWWGRFNPNPAPQSSGTFHQRLRMPPPSYM